MIRKSLFIIAVFILCSTHSIVPKTLEDISDTVYETIDKIQNKLPERDGKLDRLQSQDSFSEEELIKIVDFLIKTQYVNSLETEDLKTLKRAKASLVKLLKHYTVNGFSFCMDVNGAFFYDPQNPKFDVVFKNSTGDTKVKSFQAQINSIGLKWEFALKLNLVFFVGGNFNYLDSEKPLNLGMGIDINIATSVCGIAITYAPFINAPGGILVVGMPLGITMPALSIVTGGTLTPCK